jgi:hypothetical protein
MKTRKPLAIAAAAAMTMTAGLVVAANPSQAAATKSYAWGLAINGEPKQPYVESTDGSTQTDPDASFPPEAEPLLAGDIIKFQAGDDYANISIADLKIASAASELEPLFDELQNLQQACEGLGDAPTDQLLDGVRENLPTGVQLPSEEQVLAFCSGLIDADIASLLSIDTFDVECKGDSGSVTLADTKVLGAAAPEPLQGDVPVDTKLFTGDAAPLAELVQVTFNRQTKKPNGAFSVDGMVLEVGGGGLEVIVGHTTCGEPIEQPAAETAGRAPAPKQAEAPKPVRQSVPVTG